MMTSSRTPIIFPASLLLLFITIAATVTQGAVPHQQGDGMKKAAAKRNPYWPSEGTGLLLEGADNINNLEDYIAIPYLPATDLFALSVGGGGSGGPQQQTRLYADKRRSNELFGKRSGGPDSGSYERHLRRTKELLGKRSSAPASTINKQHPFPLLDSSKKRRRSEQQQQNGAGAWFWQQFDAQAPVGLNGFSVAPSDGGNTFGGAPEEDPRIGSHQQHLSPEQMDELLMGALADGGRVAAPRQRRGTAALWGPAAFEETLLGRRKK